MSFEDILASTRKNQLEQRDKQQNAASQNIEKMKEAARNAARMDYQNVRQKLASQIVANGNSKSIDHSLHRPIPLSSNETHGVPDVHEGAGEYDPPCVYLVEERHSKYQITPAFREYYSVFKELATQDGLEITYQLAKYKVRRNGYSATAKFMGYYPLESTDLYPSVLWPLIDSHLYSFSFTPIITLSYRK